MKLYFHATRKGDAATWTKRANKAGFDARFEAITDSEGRTGHGAGSMGYNVIVEADYEARAEILGMDPQRRRYM